MSLMMDNNLESQRSKSLFPAYVVQTSENSLFPAYSTSAQPKEDVNKQKDWLENSSYCPSNFKETCLQPKNDPIVEIDLTETQSKEKKKKHHKKSKKKHVPSKPAHPVAKSFEVPESDSIRHQLNKKVFIEETGLSFERAFRIDSKSDPENIYYDHLEQKLIARYRLYPKDPLGFSLQQRNSWNSNVKKETKDPVLRYFSKKAVKAFVKSVSSGKDSLVIKTETQTVGLDFVPLTLLPHSTARSVSTNVSKPDFEGISKSWRYSDAPPAVDNEVEAAAPDDSELRRRTVAFNRQLSERPRDVQLWLDFVEFQEQLLNSPEAQKSSVSLTESSLTEKKLAILDKALKHSPKSVDLHVARLNICRSVWDIEKVIGGWDQLIFYNPNDARVWNEYIAFILTNLTYFSTPRVLKVFAKCIRTLSNLSEGIITSHAPPPELMINLIDTFVQLCYTLRSCGYSEKAVAAFQALAEFNFFSPASSSGLSVQERAAFFEPFWDCGAARFGEDGAVGWATTVDEKKIVHAKIVTESDLTGLEDDILCQKLPEWSTWLEFERMRDTHHWLPWRPNPDYDQTDDDIDDVERIVPFDEVSRYLFWIPEERLKFLLVQHFVNFLGFNPHHLGCNPPSPNQASCRLRVRNYDVISDKLGDTLFGETGPNPLSFPKPAFSADRVNFAKNVFAQSSAVFDRRHGVLLSLQWLRFLKRLALDPALGTETLDGVKKFAKNVLKEPANRNCLQLWFEYICAELASGTALKAKKTAETLLASATSAVASGSMEVKELWYFVRSCVEQSLGFHDDGATLRNGMFERGEVLRILAHIGSGDPYVPSSDGQAKPTQVLKASSAFKNLLNKETRAIESSLGGDLCYCLDPYAYSFVDCIKCYAFFKYFSQGLDAAIGVLEDWSSSEKLTVKEEQKRYIQELVCVFQAELLQFHTRTSTASMKPLTLFLCSSVEKYPNSVQLLQILVRWRNASSVISPTRRFFSKILRESCKTNPITWIFAIASELSISHSIISALQEYETAPSCSGIKWKIRSLYEKALDSSVCGYIPELWRSYLQFELLNKEEEKAKSIFHQALQNCGWSKELIMDGIQSFPDDLKQIINFMVEKDIRVHTPLEEVSLLMDNRLKD